MMFAIKSYALWFKVAFVAALVVIALVLLSGGAKALSGCQKVNGKFTLQTISGPTCSSSAILCAVGVYKGDLKGNSEFTGASLIPTADTPTTSVLLLTGDNMIHTQNGDLITKDAIVFRTVGAGE